MLLRRQDRRIDIIEIKFHTRPFTITKAYHDQMINKRDIFEEEVSPGEALALIMLTTRGVIRNVYSNILTDSLLVDVLFEKNQ